MDKKELWKLRELNALKEGRAVLVIGANRRARLGLPLMSDEELRMFDISLFGQASICRVTKIYAEKALIALERKDNVSAKAHISGMLVSLNRQEEIISLLQKRDEAA